MKRFLVYLRESKEELKKVTWPTREEITSFTVVVVVSVVVISVFLWGVDLGLEYIINLLMK